MRVVIDTNVFVSSLSSKSKFHWVIKLLIEGQFQLCVSAEIFLEYEEKLKEKYSQGVANSFLNSLKELPNVVYIESFYHWNLIQKDPDDNKFADCSVASNAHYLVSNDRHFAVLKQNQFPPINIITLEEFETIILLANLLP